MEKQLTSGLICIKNKSNITFAVCKIDCYVRDDESFKYVFTPYYEVIDLLDVSLFQGIPGLNLDIRKDQYIRENVIPTFISERVPSEKREDYYDLLNLVGMDYMDPVEYLIRSDFVYSGDPLFVLPFRERETVFVEDIHSRLNSAGIIKMLLDNLAIGNRVVLGGKFIGGKELFDTLSFIYQRGLKLNALRQSFGIEKAKSEGKYKGRKPVRVDELAFLKELDKVNRGKISPKEAANNLHISLSKYYRYKNSISER